MVLDLLAELLPTQRAPVVLVDLYELSIEDAAEILSIWRVLARGSSPIHPHRSAGHERVSHPESGVAPRRLGCRG